MHTHKEFVLRALERIVALEKGESDQETADDVEHHFRHQVGRASPIVRGIAHEQRPHLVDPRRRKSGTDGRRHRGRALANDGIYLVVDERRLGGIDPHLVPVYFGGRCCPSTDDVEDELGSVQQHIKRSTLGTSIGTRKTYGFSSAPQ